jgi:hypothetical protein
MKTQYVYLRCVACGAEVRFPKPPIGELSHATCAKCAKARDGVTQIPNPDAPEETEPMYPDDE